MTSVPSALSNLRIRVGGVSGMALATGLIVWTLPRKYRRLAPCRSRIRLLVLRRTQPENLGLTKH